MSRRFRPLRPPQDYDLSTLARTLPVVICPIHHCLYLPPGCPGCAAGEEPFSYPVPPVQERSWGEIGVESAPEQLSDAMAEMEIACQRRTRRRFRLDWWMVAAVLTAAALVWFAGWLLTGD